MPGFRVSPKSWGEGEIQLPTYILYLAIAIDNVRDYPFARSKNRSKSMLKQQPPG